jgi:phosphoserine phosphatase RsbU/P
MIFSDGVTEAQDLEGDEFGDERLATLVQAHRDLMPSSLVESVVETIHRFGAGAVQNDDITVLALRYMGT